MHKSSKATLMTQTPPEGLGLESWGLNLVDLLSV